MFSKVSRSKFLEAQFKAVGKFSLADIVFDLVLLILCHGFSKLCLEFSQYVLWHLLVYMAHAILLSEGSTFLLD